MTDEEWKAFDEKRKPIRELLTHQNKMGFKEFLTIIKSFCIERRGEDGDYKCIDCPLIRPAYFCGWAPLDVVLNDFNEVFTVLQDADFLTYTGEKSPDEMNYYDFCYRIKLCCLERDIYTDEENRCKGCAMNAFCNNRPFEYSEALFSDMEKIIRDFDMNHMDTESHS